jgi:hypothetical protein
VLPKEISNNRRKETRKEKEQANKETGVTKNKQSVDTPNSLSNRQVASSLKTLKNQNLLQQVTKFLIISRNIKFTNYITITN